MANKLVRGAWPVVGTGGSTTPRLREYAYTNTTASIGQGSFVVLRADGSASNMPANGASNILGVAAYFISKLGSRGLVHVFDDPETQFEIQTDDAGTTNRAAAVGNNFSLVTLSHNATTHKSSTLVDGGSGSTAVALRPVKCIAVSRNVDKDETGASMSYLGLIVQINPQMHIWAKDSSVGV